MNASDTNPSDTNPPDIHAARRFLAAQARVLEVRQFEYLFADGDAAPIREAVAAYRNADGGFGHALEPDCRCPDSHPMAIDFALRTLNEAEVWDQELADGALRWLSQHAPTEGGAVFPGSYGSGWPHAPWYTPQENDRASIISTSYIAGTLQARKIVHPWLERATDLLWTLIDTLTTTDPYEVRSAFYFLDQVPDRERARDAARKLGEHIFRNGLVTLDPEATGTTHTPLDYAPFPHSLGRMLFDASMIETHLDHLAHAQREDGGWMFAFPVWSSAAEREWRGHVTVDALRVLRANQRL